jgi:hypothetical protein
MDKKIVTFRHILFAIFFDRCEDIPDSEIVGFYHSVLNFFESTSNSLLEDNNDDFFIYETIIYIIRQFDIIDPTILFQFVKNPETFRNVMAEQLNHNRNYINESMEKICGEFQGFKEGHMTRSLT